MTIDKLGIKLYDKAADAVSELISNSYDSDAENVKVSIPLGVYLDTPIKSTVNQYEIIVEDDGHGMGVADANNFFLKIGLERRTDENRTSTNVTRTKNNKAGTYSLEKDRHVFGRKGIGKLAPFGICKEIEIWSAGGNKNEAQYEISNFILNYSDIKQKTEENYHPVLGNADGKFTDKRGTKIILRQFTHRKASKADIFLRQLARKFNLNQSDFNIRVQDTITGESHSISALDLEKMPGTVMNIDENIRVDDKDFHINGWIAYSKHPYKNTEMSGVRIYAHGKLATTTTDFGSSAGFTGEYNIRSYMIGEINADWLDGVEDLITSNRQDILWSTEKGQKFQEWGEKIMKTLGTKSRNPLREQSYKKFFKASDYEKYARKMYGKTEIYTSAIEIGKSIGKMLRLKELDDENYVKEVKQLCIMLAPHKQMVESLKKISSTDIDFNTLSGLFSIITIAEAASLGQVAVERVNVIKQLENFIDKIPDCLEEEFQKILKSSPWLINPEWTLLQSNQTLETLRHSFQTYLNKKNNNTEFKKDEKSKRPDFIMDHGQILLIVEIKRPSHKLSNEEYERLEKYYGALNDFLDSNDSYRRKYEKLQILLICDDVDLNGSSLTAYNSRIKDRTMINKSWFDFLNDTKKVHTDFLNYKDKFMKPEKPNE